MFRNIEYNLLPGNKASKKVASRLLELVRGSHPQGNREKQKRHCDLIAANLINYKGQSLRYSRRNGPPINGRYMGGLYSGYMIAQVVDCLVSNGYLTTSTGFYELSKGTGETSTLTPTNELLKLIGKDQHWIERKNVELIRLKNRKKVLIDYEDTNKTKSMRNNLEKINSLIGSVMIGGVANIDPTKKHLYRVFNGDFQSGGRFYGGWWESCPKDQRRRIKIDGERTVEVDYSSHHLRILYAKEKVKPPSGDLYLLDDQGESERPLMKAVNLLAICSSSRYQAIGAIEKKARELGFIGYDIPKLLEAFLEMHHPIKHHYYSGIGLSLQYTDSCIAEKVMLILASDLIVCLSVHDSFIVQQRHGGYLKEVMGSVYLEFEVDLENTGLESGGFSRGNDHFSRGNDHFSRGNDHFSPRWSSSSPPSSLPPLPSSSSSLPPPPSSSSSSSF